MSSQELEKLLASLREETRGVEAPKHVEAALRSAFRTQSRTPQRPVWMPWALGAAAAVAVLIGAGVWKFDQPVPAMPPVRVAAAAPPALVQAAPAPARIVPPVAAKRVKPTPRPRVEPVKPEASAATEVATDFMPLEDSVSLPPLESGHILRVQMPRSNMMRFGFPVNPDRMMEPVKADVVFGQDGIARAVRFVR
jgi:hypothetical protein